ncbi:MAG TPA: TonB-dependent receptor, partial [Flavobacteriaceae bacterium]|nr:TonB-dependent receptor [Flavobacteriaceae bacterium]
MKKLTLLLILFSTSLFSQNLTIKGVVKSVENNPISNVSVSVNNKGTSTSALGKYLITVKANDTLIITFSHISYKTLQQKIISKNKSIIEFSPILEAKIEEIDEVVIKNKKEAQNAIQVNPKNTIQLPGANNGVENVIMTFAGVNNTNELSTQYNVRGGNFDENLIYVNGIEIYRPFLIRSGQQEGLSFVNPEMVENIKFSAGGFQAKYGDRMSSVLDITYRIPKTFSTRINASLLGGSVTLENALLNNKLRVIGSARYRNNNLFLNSKDTETNSKPIFTDIQLFTTYLINNKFNLNFLGNYALNNYNFKPLTRKTKFGTLANPLELIVFYEGEEKDKFKTLFGALQANYLFSERLNFTFTTSAYHTIEEEYYDILASYNLGEVNSDFTSNNFGEVEFATGIGSQLNHARNDLDAFIFNTEIKTLYKKDNHLLEGGIKFQTEDIKDKINEWEVIDSVGFNVRPPYHSVNNQPYEPYNGEIVPFQYINAKNNTTINRFMWFTQYSNITFLGNHKLWYNLGIRGQHWKVSDNTKNNSSNILSWRTQFSIQPNWKKDMLFKLALGTYHQPPFYKELRNKNGIVNTGVEAQKSTHFIIGNEYSFNLWNRPFKLISEIYYKAYRNVNTYTVDNVRVKYLANNNAKAYATGFDLRLNGEFVPGTQSWVSLGFLKTEENYNNQGYIARPTDQRFKFGLLFQDYMPNIPNIKMYLNLVYNTGVPGGSPSYISKYDYQNRLNDYKR